MQKPHKVLFSGGHEVGGLASFVEGLASGFEELGIPTQVVPPSQLIRHWRDLRDSKVLCILSTIGMFFAPFARRAICVAHAIPIAGENGWGKTLGYFAALKLADVCPGTQLVAVSHYVSVHLASIFTISADSVVHNPLRRVFLEPHNDAPQDRLYITYVGRLIKAKNLHRLLPAIRSVLDDIPGMRACIIGDGPQRTELEKACDGDSRIEFTGSLDSNSVREWYRRTRVFVSAHYTEALGISFLEALSQGCAVAMPASGGGLELGLHQIGKQIQLLPISLDREEVRTILRRAVAQECVPMSMEAYIAKAVALAYLQVDSHRFSAGNTSLALHKRGPIEPAC